MPNEKIASTENENCIKIPQEEEIQKLELPDFLKLKAEDFIHAKQIEIAKTKSMIDCLKNEKSIYVESQQRIASIGKKQSASFSNTMSLTLTTIDSEL